MKKFFYIYLLLGIYTCSFAKNVGLLIVATGKYITYAQRLIESADKYFCKNHTVTYFVFTDATFAHKDNVVVIEQKRLGWPYDTMMRLSMYYEHRSKFEKMDYLFASDADMLFVDDVGDEILSDLVATQHPGFVGKKPTYETRKESTAYVAPNQGEQYFAGGFNGGSRTEFLKMAEQIKKNVEIDLKKNVIAVWHDESHLNRYLINNPPTCILSPSYCYPESWKLNYHKRLLALDKNHAEMRA